MGRYEKEKIEDLKMMKDPASWSRWPILPVKKIPENGERMEFGFLLALGKPIVYLKNMYDLHDLIIKSVKDITTKIESKEYNSFDSILDDGWIVD